MLPIEAGDPIPPLNNRLIKIEKSTLLPAQLTKVEILLLATCVVSICSPYLQDPFKMALQLDKLELEEKLAAQGTELIDLRTLWDDTCETHLKPYVLLFDPDDPIALLLSRPLKDNITDEQFERFESEIQATQGRKPNRIEWEDFTHEKGYLLSVKGTDDELIEKTQADLMLFGFPVDIPEPDE